MTVDIYDNPFEFLDDVFQYPLDTKLVFDNQYYHDNGESDDSYGINGGEVARRLHEKGYTKLFMVTGEAVANQKDYYKVILKGDAMAKNLHKL